MLAFGAAVTFGHAVADVSTTLRDCAGECVLANHLDLSASDYLVPLLVSRSTCLTPPLSTRVHRCCQHYAF